MVQKVKDSRKGSILIAEDEVSIAIDMEAILKSANYNVLPPQASLSSVMETIATYEIGLAVLDVNLQGEMIFPVCDLLAADDIPFVLVSGYSVNRLPPEHRGRPLLDKPWEPSRLLELVREAMASPRVPVVAPKPALSDFELAALHGVSLGMRPKMGTLTLARLKYLGLIVAAVPRLRVTLLGRQILNTGQDNTRD